MDICIAECGQLTSISITLFTIITTTILAFLLYFLRKKVWPVIVLSLIISCFLVYFSLNIMVVDDCMPCGSDSIEMGSFKLLPF